MLYTMFSFVVIFLYVDVHDGGGIDDDVGGGGGG